MLYSPKIKENTMRRLKQRINKIFYKKRKKHTFSII